MPAFFVWLSGLIFLFTDSIGRKYLAVAIVYFTTIAGLFFFNGKGYYSMGLYPTLFALGGIAIEKWTTNKNFRNQDFACIPACYYAPAADTHFAGIGSHGYTPKFGKKL